MTGPKSLIEAGEVERLLRQEWWLNHGHSITSLYGDDGEMQCGACRVDFKRTELGSLHTHVLVVRVQNASERSDG